MATAASSPSSPTCARRGNRTCRRLEAASSPRPHPVILLSMKFKLFIGTVAFAMLVLAVAGWAVDGLRWALPARA